MSHKVMSLFACFAVACSLTPDPAPSEGKTNEQSVKSNQQTQAAGILGATGGNPEDGVDQLVSAGSSSQGNIAPASVAIHSELLPSTVEIATGPTGDPGCACAAGSCTFTNCQRGGATLDGTLTAKGGVFKCDFTWKNDNSQGGASAGYASKVSLHIKADMTTTPTTIKGSYHTDGAIETSGPSLPSSIPGVGAGFGNITWVNDATWDVTVGANKISGGSITHNGTYTAGGKTYTGNGNTTF